MREVRVEPYGPRWEEAHQVFARHMFPKKKRRSDPAYLYWKFRSFPGDTEMGLFVAVDGDKVVGQWGHIPVDIQVGGRQLKAQWSCDAMLLPEYRGSGVSKALQQAGYDRKIATLGSDASPQAHRAMVKVGFHSLPSYPKYFIPVSLGNTLALKFPFLRHFDWVKHPLLWLLSRSGFSNIQSVTDFEAIKALLLKNPYKGQLPHVVYNEEFINWRFRPFQQWYKPPSMFRFSNSDYFGYQVSNGMLYLALYRFSDEKNAGTAVKFLWREANRLGLKCISVVADPVVEKAIRRFGVLKRPIPLRILAKDYPVEYAAHTFHYTFIDSDENI